MHPDEPAHAEPLPAESGAGNPAEDPAAEAVLAESEERVAAASEADAPADAADEHRTSAETAR